MVVEYQSSSNNQRKEMAFQGMTKEKSSKMYQLFKQAKNMVLKQQQTKKESAFGALCARFGTKEEDI